MKYEHYDLSVCVVCIHLLANGEYDDGTDVGEQTAEKMAQLWGDNTRHLVPGNYEQGFRVTTCDGCGSQLHGDRHEAHALIPSD